MQDQGLLPSMFQFSVDGGGFANFEGIALLLTFFTGIGAISVGSDFSDVVDEGVSKGFPDSTFSGVCCNSLASLD